MTLVAPPVTAHPDGEHLLVFAKTAGFRHDSIPDGIAAITELGAANGFTVEATEDAAAFTDANLAGFDAVVWLSTTGDVLDDAQQQAFQRFVENGGGYAGVRAAADTEYSWPWYGGLVGSYFKSHPAIQEADVAVEDHGHPSTAHLPDTWTRADEWYSYQSNPRSNVKVLAAVDEASYTPTDPSGDHPISWCHTPGQGGSWYTGMGHTKESYADPAFRQHLLGGLRYALGVAPADCEPEDVPPTDGDFDQVTLALGEEKTGEPIALAVLPDRAVVHTSRDGRVWLTSPEATTTLAGRVPVYNHDEDGLQGVAADPDFLQVPADRGLCCHAGGEIDFDAAGNLYLSTGDDTNPFASDGYTPIDERADRNPAFDAQRSSANTDDLRGKVLRIKVRPDGTYTVPDGNLFAPGTDKTRPEIYAMGFRNPFRFTVDKATGWIHLGDYGPDAGAADPDRGPGGSVEFNLIKAPGNYGWPYCVGDGVPYVDHDFATGTSGAAFDCAAPKNTSPRGWDDYVELAPSPITDPGGTHRLYFVFRGGRGALPDVDTITFRGPGTVAAADVPAEALTGQQGVAVYDRETAQGGRRVGEIHDGDWASYADVDLSKVAGIGYRVSSGGVGGTLEAHADSPTGPLVHEPLTVPVTGSWDLYLDLVPQQVSLTGVRDLHLVFKGGAGALYDVDTIRYLRYRPVSGTCAPTEPEAGYRSLYDGTGVAGWRQAGPGRFVVEDCALRTEGGLGLLWHEEQLSAYSLKFDWKVAGDDNSGVFVGFPDPGADPWVAVDQGYEVQIDATDAPDRTTGAVCSFQSADIPARDAAVKPPGGWNTYEIVVSGQRLRVFLNGALVNDFTSTDPARDLTSGHIGLQNHGDGDDVWFRHVRVKDLPN